MLLLKKLAYIGVLCLVFFVSSCKEKVDRKEVPEFLAGHSNVEKFEGFEQPEDTIQLLRQHSFGLSDAIIYQNISRLAVDERGRLYLSTDAINVYDSDGAYVRSIGRKGRGPGEFQTIHNFKIRNNRLYVYDANLSRISVFNLDSFALEGELIIPQVSGKRGLGEFAVKKDGSLIIGMKEIRKLSNTGITERYMHYFFMDGSGIVEKDEFTVTKWKSYYKVQTLSGTSYPPVPFHRTTIFSLSPSDRMYYAWTGSIAIKVLDSSGNYKRGIYYPYKNKRISGEMDYPNVYHVLNIIPETKRVLGNDLPITHPAIAHFFVDDEERIWLATIEANKEMYEWRVLTKRGDLLAKFKWPANRIIKAVKQGTAYVAEREDGDPKVMVYKLNFISMNESYRQKN